MRHRQSQARRTGFTLVELLVVIAIIGTLVGLLLPAVQAARETARSNTCRNNLTQFQKGLTSRESSVGDYPGYINKLGIAGSGAANQLRASWVVMTFPYIEQNNLWQKWSNAQAQTSQQQQQLYTSVEILVCPSDPPEAQGQANLSYVVNAGYIENEQGGVLSGSGIRVNNAENIANGVFFDLTRTSDGAPGPTDIRDSMNAPELKMRQAYIGSKGDGMTGTLMLTENMNATLWGYPFTGDYSSTPDKKWHFGFCWEQLTVVASQPGSTPMPKQDGRARRINGQNIANDAPNFASMVANDGFPSSNHPGGVNAAFCGGNVQFISDQIEPFVYAQLMTSNRNKSDLLYNGKQEGTPGVPQPSGEEY